MLDVKNSYRRGREQEFPDMCFVQRMAIPEEKMDGNFGGLRWEEDVGGIGSLQRGMRPGMNGMGLEKGMDRPEADWVAKMREKSRKMTDFS